MSDMENKKRFPSSNSIITGLMTAAFAVVMGLLYSYWFDLNDDVLMKDILSGVFTGKPQGHNIQMLYPISFLISRVYMIFKDKDCYGIYLILCQYASLFVMLRYFAGVPADVIINRIGDKASGMAKIFIRLVCNVVVLIMFLTVVAGHFVIIQYTFVVAMMCSAATVLYYERKYIAGTVFIAFAFCTRSEMTLLMLPFVLLAFYYRYMDGKLTDKENIKRTAMPIVAIVAVLVLSELVNYAGYSSKEWKEFTSFFDSRTKVYDFYQIPDYEENKSFYDSIDLKKSEYELLKNYNFGIDDAIDADKMAEIAAYGKELSGRQSIASKVRANIHLYYYRLFKIGRPVSFEYPQTDSPWNILTYLMYLIAFVMFVLYERTRFSGVLKVAAAAVCRLLPLFAGRTLIWLYIMIGGRDPIRITHSLYLIEITILVILSEEMLRRVVNESINNLELEGADRTIREVLHIYAGFCLLAFFALGFRYLPLNLAITDTECKGRIQYNKAYEELEDYCKGNPDKFYFVDVYTSVAYADTGYTYSQKMFGKSNDESNMTLMGGWASKSPIEKEKLGSFGLDTSMGEAVFDEKSFIVTDKDSDIEWMKAYYGDMGKSIDVQKTDEVAGEFVIWKVGNK